MNNNTYVICVTKFQEKLAKTISSEHDAKLVRIIRASESNPITILKSIFVFLMMLINLIFRKNAKVIISHPFNPWTAVASFFSGRISLYDDGIAYYANTKINIKYLCFYYFLFNRHFVNSSTKDIYGYSDLMRTVNAEEYYCLFPDFPGLSEKVKKIQINTLVFRNSSSCSDGKVVFLDTAKAVSNSFNTNAIVNFLISEIEVGQVLYYKPHPLHKKTCIGEALRKSGLTIIQLSNDVSLEEFFYNNNIDSLFSFYSSAIFGAVLSNPGCDVSVITNQYIESVISVDGIIDYFDARKVEF